MGKILNSDQIIRTSDNPECVDCRLPRWLVHDLLQPLNAYGLAAAQVDVSLRAMLPAGHDLLARLELMDASVRNEEHLLNTLRVYLRGADEPAAIPLESVSVMEVLQPVVERHRRRAPAMRIDLSGDDGLFARSAFAPLRDLLEALIENAVQSAHFQVRIDCQESGDELEICIADDGPGVPDDMLSVLGQPFVRSVGQKRSNHRGLGLGVHNAATIAETLGHRLFHRKGATTADGAFCLRLAKAPPPRRREGGNYDPLAGTRIVVVGLEDSLEQALTRLLTTWQCEASGAGDKRASVRAQIEQVRPDVAILGYAAWCAWRDEMAATPSTFPLRVMVIATRSERDADAGGNVGPPMAFVRSPPSPSRVRMALVDLLAACREDARGA